MSARKNVSPDAGDGTGKRVWMVSGLALLLMAVAPALSALWPGLSLFGFPFPYFVACFGLPLLLILLAGFGPAGEDS